MYFPHSSFIVFIRDLDTLVKTAVDNEGFKKHGDEVIRAKYCMLECVLVDMYKLFCY